MMRSITFSLLALALISLLGCKGDKPPDYGVERPVFLPGSTRQTWAVAPVINLSGEKQVDAIIQADLVYQQLQQVAGITAIPVNRVAEVYAALRIDQVHSEEQAALICDLLGCDALLVATVSIFDPYAPPKLGASLTLFRKGGYRRPVNVDPRELVRRAAPLPSQSPTTSQSGAVQVVGMFDAANGSIRADVVRYAQGRNDPAGPYKDRAYLVEMDRFCGFVYHSLIEELLTRPAMQR